MYQSEQPWGTGVTQYAGKVAVVTGAAAGLGRALALDLGARGARLALCDLNAEGLAETADRLIAAGAEVMTDTFDVGDGPAMRAFAQAVQTRYGTVHQLYNNAGRTVPERPVVNTPDRDFALVFRANIWGVIHGTRAFLPPMIASGNGLLCNISSLNGVLALGQATAYSTSKFAVCGFTEAVRIEMLDAGHPVEVALVLPGGIATDIARVPPAALAAMSRTERSRAEAHMDELYSTLLTKKPEDAAREILDRLARGRRRITITPRAYWLDLLVRGAPAQYPRLVAAFQRRSRDRAKGRAQPGRFPADGR